MLQFVTGPVKSGKTSYCINQMASENHTVMIIPEQVSLQYENKIIDKTGCLTSDRDVLSFGRLFYRIYKETCLKKRAYISPVGKAVIINKILISLAPKLKIFSNENKAQYIANDILSTVSEFKRYGITPEQLSNANIGEGAAKYKINDLSEIYNEYNNELLKCGCDSEDNLALLSSLICKSEFVKKTDFYIDCFSSFTGNELLIILELVKYAKSVTVTLKTDEKNGYLFSSVNDTKQKILSMVQPESVLPDIVLKGNHIHKNGLLFLAENYGTYNNAQYSQNTEDIVVYESDNTYNEVDLCARSIRKDIMNGYKFKDIGVITNNIAEYSHIIEKSFNLHEIRYFLDRRTPIAGHPICVLFASLFNIYINNFQYEAVFTFLKTGLTDIPQSDIDILENYVLETGIKGNLWLKDWIYKKDVYDLEHINNIRNEFLSIVLPFRSATKGKTKIDDYICALRNFTIQIKLAEKAEQISAELLKSGKKQQATEFRQVFNYIADALLQIKLGTDNSAYGIEKFSKLFSTAISVCEVGSIPPSVDCVSCGSLDRTRHQDIKILYILGADSENFPGSVNGTGIITDYERRNLENCNISLAPDNKAKILEQPFKIYETLTTPTEKLVISYCISDKDGQILKTSPVISTLKTMFPLLKKKQLPDFDDLAFVSTPQATIKQMVLKNPSPIWESVKKWYSQSTKWKDKINYILSAKNYTLSSEMNEHIAKELFGKELYTTITRLETYAKCPFEYFTKYGLKLEERKKYAFEAVDSGNFIHKILEEFVKSQPDWITLSEQDCKKYVEDVSKNAVNELLDKLPLITKRHMFLTGRLKKASSDAAWAVTNHIRKSIYRPYAAELTFGKDSSQGPIELTTKEGNKITLLGKIDRIDTDNDSFRIIDYKSSSHDLSLSEVYNGMSLQLFVYAMVLKKSFGSLDGMLYLTINAPLIKISPEETKVSDINLFRSFKMNGYLVGDTNTITKMDNDFTGHSVIIPAASTSKGLSSKRILSPEQFDRLSKIVTCKVTEYGDNILNGNLPISPVKFSDRTSCTYCSYNSICGFENKINCFRKTDNLSDEQVIDILNNEGENNGN